MHSTLFIALLAGLGSMLGWGFADFFAKKTIDEIGDVKTLFWSQLFGVFPLVGIFLFSSKVSHLNTYDPLFLILLGAVGGMSYLPLYSGFGKGEVSILSPIFASYSVVVVVLAAIFLHSAISTSHLLAIFLVFVGILLLSGDPREIRQYLKIKTTRVKGIPDVLSAMLIYSFWLLFLDKFLNGKSWVFPLLIIRLVSTVTLLAYAFIKNIQLTAVGKSLWKFLILIGLFDVSAFAWLSYGYSHTSYVGVVTVLGATFSLPTMVLAAVFLKERMTKLQASASFLIICGIVAISLG